MAKFKIESDGTTETTEVYVDGSKITEDEDIVYANFSASVRYSKYVMFGYTSKMVGEDGETELTSYSYSSPDDDEDDYPVMRKTTRPPGLGQATAEDMQSLLDSETILGAQYRTEQVIDASMIDPRHRGVISDIMKGKSYRIESNYSDNQQTDDE